MISLIKQKKKVFFKLQANYLFHKINENQYLNFGMSNNNSAKTDPLHNLDELLEKAEEYTEEKIQLFKLKTARQTANLASGIAYTLLFWGIVAIALLLINIGIAIWVGQLLSSNFAGFLILSAVYLIVALIIKAFRKPVIENSVKNNIIQKIFNGNGNQENQ